MRGSTGFVAKVTWNSVDVTTAGTASAALAVDFSSTANVLFQWSAATGTTININDARLQMIYFGAALSTRDVAPISSGALASNSAVLNWSPGALTYVLEGVYKITASLLNPNGSTVWSEDFFVRASAPYSVLAALPIILIALGAWELYVVARSGRLAALKGKEAAPPSPPSGPSPPAEATPATEDSGTPPAGGAS